MKLKQGPLGNIYIGNKNGKEHKFIIGTDNKFKLKLINYNKLIIKY